MRRVYFDYDNTMFDFWGRLEKLIQSNISKSFKKELVKTYDFNRTLGNAPLSEVVALFSDKDSLEVCLNELRETGECPSLLGGVDSKTIISLMGEIELYAESKCLTDNKTLSRVLSGSRLYPVINSGISSVGNVAEQIEVKKSRVAKLFKGIEYSEGYHVGVKPIHADAFAVLDDDLGYLTKYVDAGSDAILLLINHNHNSFEFNPKYAEYRDRIIRVRDINEALTILSSENSKGDNWAVC